MEGEENSEINNGTVDTGRAERLVWLMKCPLVNSKSWESRASSSDPNALAKVVLSLDPLCFDDPSTVQFTIKMNGSDMGPRSYSLNMFNDFVPMSIFSECEVSTYASSSSCELTIDPWLIHRVVLDVELIFETDGLKAISELFVYHTLHFHHNLSL